MGLMTEAPWEYYVPPSTSASNSNQNAVDYHRENLRQLRKMQQLAKMKKETEPVKAFALTEANKKKFDHVQSKVHEWVVTANGGRESKASNFLRGHQKTGPFLEGSDNDSAIRVKRLSGLKANLASKDKLQPSDYGTMSAQSSVAIPPLNLEESEEFDEAFQNCGDEEEDLRREVSLGYLGIGSRFSDISIDDRRDRIKNLINEIYNTCPLNQGNPTRKSLNQSIKRYASMDTVSDVESVITNQNQRPQRSSHPAKLTRHPSYSSAINRASVLRKYASSPKLNTPKLSVQNLAANGQMFAKVPLSSASSMINIKTSKADHHLPLRKNVSNPEPLKKISNASSASAASAKSEQIIEENDEETIKNDDDEQDQDQDDVQSLMIRGSDIDYVRANIQCASSVGHVRRKEFEAAAAAEAERKKKKSEQMKPGDKYKTGSVPKYLEKRQAAWKAEAERIEREKPDPDCPVGHRKLSDGDRREALGQMKERYKNLLAQANAFPVRADTLRVRQAKADIEAEMRTLEESIRTYERPKVFVKIE